MALIFDTHAHYDDAQFDADREALLSAMPENGVGLILDPGCDLESSRAAIALAEQYPHIYAAVGYHPENCAPYTDADLDILRRLAQHPKVVAIGEIGLDYYWEQNPPKEFQQAVFRAQLALAQELSLPVIVHDRDAHADCLAIVKEFPEVRGVFHCYSGSAEMARELVRRGWYVGFTGVVTFKNARRAVETVEALPLDRILIETDCPYMAPEPYRGRRNDPSYVPLVAARIAGIKGISPEEAGRITRENAARLFRLELE